MNLINLWNHEFSQINTIFLKNLKTSKSKSMCMEGKIPSLTPIIE